MKAKNTKNLIIIFTIITSLSFFGLHAQDNNPVIYTSFKFNPKIAFLGLGNLSIENNKAFNWELEAGIELDKIRFSLTYEENHQIGYSKLAWVKSDWIIRNKIFGINWLRVNGFNQYIGGEISVITLIKHDWRGYVSMFCFSPSFEIQYEFSRDFYGVVKYNYPYNHFSIRHGLMVGITFKFKKRKGFYWKHKKRRSIKRFR